MLDKVLVMDRFIAVAALIASLAAAFGVAWQIWRSEQQRPRMAVQFTRKKLGSEGMKLAITPFGTQTMHEVSLYIWYENGTKERIGEEEPILKPGDTMPCEVKASQLVGAVAVGFIWYTPERDEPYPEGRRIRVDTRDGECELWKRYKRPRFVRAYKNADVRNQSRFLRLRGSRILLDRDGYWRRPYDLRGKKYREID